MRIRKKNLAKLASLSAVGAGALGVAAPNAVAGAIQYTYFHPPFPYVTNSSYATSFPIGHPSALFKVKAYASTFETLTNGTFLGGAVWKREGKDWVVPGGGIASLQFLAQLTSRVGPWRSTAFSKSGVDRVNLATRHWHTDTTSGKLVWTGWGFGWSQAHTTRSTQVGGTQGAQEYLLFRYGSAPDFTYGWLELSATFTPLPKVTLYEYATESTGSATPEPSTATLGGLAALALGAEGLRRWRAGRKRAA